MHTGNGRITFALLERNAFIRHSHSLANDTEAKLLRAGLSPARVLDNDLRVPAAQSRPPLLGAGGVRSCLLPFERVEAEHHSWDIGSGVVRAPGRDAREARGSDIPIIGGGCESATLL